MAAIAARTEHIKLVSTIFILPLYHPLDVAEWVSSLDNISAGRVVLGVGSGYRPYEAAAVGVPFGQRVSRMQESIAILRAAWTEGKVSFEGEHFRVDDVEIYPKPVQSGGPPIWLGALERKPVERAGKIADGWIAPYIQSVPTLKSRADAYRAAAHDAGRSSTICLERDMALSVDRDAAQAAWMDRNVDLINYYRKQGAALPDIDPTLSGFGALGPGRAVAGTPDDCVHALQRAETELGCEYLSLMNLGLGSGMGHPGNFAYEAEALRLFGTEVLPAFR
jgi:alkanesulfonate monooxygenase SsuD/methylene tetrahydromethanopterin reductase-like flavin-dependent oxidoreductase (luciferase family)